MKNTKEAKDSSILIYSCIVVSNLIPCFVVGQQQQCQSLIFLL